jgi:3-carboxy-cis,cis-muconate cycloisomerase
MLSLRVVMPRNSSKFGSAKRVTITPLLTPIAVSFDRLGRETEVIGYPVLPLLRQMNQMCSPEAARYIHWGATTQDIMDTASILQMQDGLQFVEKELKDMEKTLVNLATKHRDTYVLDRALGILMA